MKRFSPSKSISSRIPLSSLTLLSSLIPAASLVPAARAQEFEDSAPAAAAVRPAPQLLGNPMLLRPERIAGVRKVGGDLVLTTDWIEYNQEGVAASCQTGRCFDNFEPVKNAWPAPPTDGFPNGGYDPDCGMGSNRWFLGASYSNTYVANDMTVCSACTCECSHSERVEFAWHWEVTGPGSSEPCYVIVFTGEDFDDLCGGPAIANLYSGVIYAFGTVPSHSGYYWSDVDLCNTGLFHQIPCDGKGGYEIIFANDITGGIVTTATCAQPMLWGTKKTGLPTENGSFQDFVQWDDDNPRNDDHDAPDECYDYTYGVCPDPLGAMIVFYSVSNNPNCLTIGDANCDGSVDFFDINPFMDALLNGTPPCDLCQVDANGDGVFDFFDIDPFIQCLLKGGC